MLIDLHVHSKSSDGALPVDEVIREAKRRHIRFIDARQATRSSSQEAAVDLAEQVGIRYVSGVELNVTFTPDTTRANQYRWIS